MRMTTTIVMSRLPKAIDPNAFKDLLRLFRNG
jgi:hypothetical protein